MGRAWLRTLFGGRTFNVLTAAFFLGSFIRGWRIDDWTWSGVKLLFGIRGGIDKPPATFPIPTKLSVTPAKAYQGETLDVNISATGATFTDRSIANFGPGITILMNRMIDATTLLVRIEIANGAVLGGRRVWVVTPRSANRN